MKPQSVRDLKNALNAQGHWTSYKSQVMYFQQQVYLPFQFNDDIRKVCFERYVGVGLAHNL